MNPIIQTVRKGQDEFDKKFYEDHERLSKCGCNGEDEHEAILRYISNYDDIKSFILAQQLAVLEAVENCIIKETSAKSCDKILCQNEACLIKKLIQEALEIAPDTKE